MAKNTKQGNPKAGGVMLVIAGILLIFVSVMLLIADIDFLTNGPKTMDELIAANNVRAGEYVEVTVDADFGAYAETKHTINGFIPAGKEQHYMVWLEDGSLISLTAKNKKTISKLEDIMDQTAAYVYGNGELTEKITLVGKITTMESELAKYYRQGLNYLGADSTTNIYYVDIDTTQNKTSVIATVVGIFLFGCLSIFGATRLFKKAKEEKLAKQAVADMQSAATPDNLSFEAMQNAYTDTTAQNAYTDTTAQNTYTDATAQNTYTDSYSQNNNYNQ